MSFSFMPSMRGKPLVSRMMRYSLSDDKIFPVCVSFILAAAVDDRETFGIPIFFPKRGCI